MNPTALANALKNCFPFQPTEEQDAALILLSKYLIQGTDQDVFLLKGYAGTGKTTLISALIRYLDENHLDCVLLAPTGRAAKVLASYSGHQALTIHRKIYRKAKVSDVEGGFGLNFNNHKNAIFIVDEASMISNTRGDYALFGSGMLLEDLLEYVYSGDSCRLILMGDTAQLPPVGSALSPALDANQLRRLGMDATTMELKTVMRQSEGSGILTNATALRERIRLNEVDQWPKIQLYAADVILLSGEQLSDSINESYARVGIDESKIITPTNKRATQFNQGIRNQVLYREDEVNSGDCLLVAKNNYCWSEAYPEIPFIANGDLVEVVRIRKTYEMYGLRFADMQLRFLEYDWEIDARVMLDSLASNTPALEPERMNQLYRDVVADYQGVCKTKKELYQALRKDPWINALQVKFGYALTCHKAQGGQWKDVFVDQGYVTEERMGLDYYRWLYTAVTRATERLFLVNFSPEMIVGQ